MRAALLSALSAAAVVAAAAASPPASAQQAEVLHWWTSGGESKAVGVIADAFTREGGTWIDNAVVTGQAARAAAMNRIAGGNPPTAMQWNVGVAVHELADAGLLADLGEVAEKEGWHDVLPPLILEKVIRDDRFVAVPVDIHATNWLWYNKAILDGLGIEPPATWDAFFEAADRIQEAGYIPLAQGGQPWQQALLFSSVLIGVGGKDLYHDVFVEHDVEAAGGEGVVRSFEALRRLTQYVDAGAANRKWNDTSMLVAGGKAAMQVMGDWAKGEFAAAGLVAGQDYGCVPAPGTGDAYVLVVDVFAFPEQRDPAVKETQEKLARVIMDPAVQAEFSRHKGALPARLDADVSDLDQCARLGSRILADTSSHLPNTALAFSNDAEGRIQDLVSAFWSNPGMTAEQAAAALADIVADADL